MLTSGKIEGGESSAIPSIFRTNSYLQNFLPSKISSSDSQTLTNFNQSKMDAKDALEPMSAFDGKVNTDRESIKSNHSVIFKESLPAPINQYAIDRIIQENNNLKKSVSGMNTMSGISTTPISSTASYYDWDYDSSKNYLSTNQVNEKNIGNVNNSAKLTSQLCGNSCGKSPDYSFSLAEKQTETPWLTDYDDEFGKSGQESTKNYYNKIMGERSVPIAFSPYPNLRKQSSAFLDIIPERQDKMISITINGDHQKVNDMKPTLKLPVGADNNFKKVNNADINNTGVNYLTSKNLEVQNSARPLPQEHSEVADSFDGFTFRSPNHNLLQEDLAKFDDQLNVPVLSSTKFSNQSSIENPEKFWMKSLKVMKVKPLKDRSISERLFLHKDDYSQAAKNFTLKSSEIFEQSQWDSLAQVDNESSKLQRKVISNTVRKPRANNLQFWNVRKKPEWKKSINRFSHHLQESEIEDMLEKFRKILIFEMRRYLWPNVIRKISQQKKLKKFPKLLITSKPINTSVSSIEQQISIKKTFQTRRPIRIRNAKFFDVDEDVQ
uniref:Rab-GAP TBC domain-containing protein n=1 Tax=Elaeophora elaphi TaxID=1147741 RepID=A0A0R3S1K7_9BILA